MTTTTDIIYIIDRSGSMDDLMAEAINGFNTFIEEQKKVPGECYVTLVAFDNKVERIFDRVDLHNMEPLTDDLIYARGATALLDAIGQSITDFPDSWHVITCIMTDGHENVSQEWTAEKIKALIEGKQAAGWEFQFAGVGIDAFDTGTNLGFGAKQIKSTMRSAAGMASYSSEHSRSVTSYRAS